MTSTQALELETYDAFWTRMVHYYNSYICHSPYWHTTDLEKNMKKSVKNPDYAFVNFTFHSELGSVHLCERFKPDPRHGTKIDIVVAAIDFDWGQQHGHPVADFQDFAVMAYILACPPNVILKHYTNLHKEAIQRDMITLADIKRILPQRH